MSLATRCTSCGTVFRVVQDQLKVSDGWVRCGRCKEVFNASEALFDLGADGALPPPAASRTATTAARATRPGALGPSLRDGPGAASAGVAAANEPARPYASGSPQMPTALPPGMPWSAPTAAGHHGAAPSAASSTMRFSAPTLKRPSADAAAYSPAPSWPDDQPPPPDQLFQRPAPWDDGAASAAALPLATPYVPQHDDEHTHFELPLMMPAAAVPAPPGGTVAREAAATAASIAIPPPASAADVPPHFQLPGAPLTAPPTAPPMAPGRAPDDAPTAALDPASAGFALPARDEASADAAPPPGVTTSMLAAEAALDSPAFVLQPPATPPARPTASPRTVRNTLFAITAVLAIALAVQAVLHWRRVIAAAWPGAHPVLQALCDGLGCTMEPLRRIEQLVVDSSALTERRPAGEPPSLQLSVTLHNRGPYEVALPLVDLSLTDPRGELLARRALTPTDFRVTRPTLAAGDETTLQLQFSAGDLRVTGYTVEIFYP